MSTVSLTSDDERGRLRRSLWLRRLHAFYTLFDTETTPSPQALDNILQHFAPDYAAMWAHLQQSTGIALPPLGEGPEDVALEATRLLRGDDPEGSGTAEVGAAVDASEARLMVDDQRSGRPSADVAHLPRWLSALLTRPPVRQEGRVLLPSTLLLRVLYRRKLAALYTLVAPALTLRDVDACLDHFCSAEVPTGAASDAGIAQDLFAREAAALEVMWGRAQEAHRLFVPPVLVSEGTLGLEGDRVIQRVAVLKAHRESAGGAARSPNTVVAATPPRTHPTHTVQLRERTPDAEAREAERRRQRLRGLETLPTPALVADYHYRRVLADGARQSTMLRLVVAGLPFSQYRLLHPADRARLNERLVLDLSLLMTRPAEGEDPIAYEPQGQPSRSDVPGASSPAPASPKRTKSDAQSPVRSPKPPPLPEDALFDGNAIREAAQKAKDGVVNTAPPRVVTTRTGPSAGSPVDASPHGGGPSLTACRSARNVIVIPIDATIRNVALHVPTMGLEITLVLTPTALQGAGGPQGPVVDNGGQGPAAEEVRLHTEYLPRLMRRLLAATGDVLPSPLRSSVSPRAGVALSLTEEFCASAQLCFEFAPNGRHVPPAPRLLDASVSINTTLTSP